MKLSSSRQEEAVAFENYDQYMNSKIHVFQDGYRRITNNAIHNTYFFNVIFPLIFQNIKASILEYQAGFLEQKKAQEAAKGETLLAGLRFAPETGVAEVEIEGEELEDLEEV
jgi:hypothetical protein